MSWEDECASCRRPIPPRGNHRRPVPSRGGKSGIVCRDCATEIDAQETLTDPTSGKVVGSKPKPERLVA